MDNNKLMVINPRKAFKKMSPYLIIFCVFDAFYSMIDLMWAGFISAEAVAIVGICSPFFLLMTNSGRTIGSGTNSVMSRYLGSKFDDFEDVNYTSNILLHGLLLCVSVGIFILLMGMTFFPSILLIMNFESSIEVFMYAFPLFLFSIIFLVIQFFPETLQAEGETKFPALILIIGSLFNLILDPIFAIVLGWGVFGLSISTVIASLIPFIIFFYLYLFKKKYTSINFSNFKLDFKILKDILIVTIPNFVDRSSYYSILSIYLNIILSFIGGAIAIAIYSFSDQVKELMSSPNRGASRATLSISGHIYGAKKIDELKSFYFYQLKIGFLISILMAIILAIINIFLVPWIFPQFEEFGWVLVFTLMIVIIFMPCYYYSSKVLDGMGLSIYTLFLTILRLILIFVFIYLLAGLEELGIMGGILVGELIIDVLYVFITLYILKRIKSKNSN